MSVIDIPHCVWSRHCDEDLCQTERITGVIHGVIPNWINGTGPGIHKFGDSKYLHAFDPCAIIHSFHISDGVVEYQNRHLESETYKKNKLQNRITVMEVGTMEYPDPCKSLFGNFMTKFRVPKPKDLTDNGIVNMINIGDDLYATTETDKICRVDKSTLETIETGIHYSNFVAVQHATAHPHTEEDGTVMNMGNAVENGRMIYKILKFPPPKYDNGQKISSLEQATIIGSIPAKSRLYPSYYHSFGITENYIILVEWSLLLSVPKLTASALFQIPITKCYVWDPKIKPLFHVLNKRTGEHFPIVFTSPSPFFCFHHINAYEEDEHIVVDACLMQGNDPVSTVFLDELMSYKGKCLHSTPTRFILPLAPKKLEEENLISIPRTNCTAKWINENEISVTHETLSDVSMDLPHTNESYNGKSYRYLYGCEYDKKNFNMTHICKVDTTTKETMKWTEKGSVVCEPSFVAAPDAKTEDDGVILTILLNLDNNNENSLLALNAKDMTELGRVQFETKGPVTPTIHGFFSKHKGKAHLNT